MPITWPWITLLVSMLLAWPTVASDSAGKTSCSEEDSFVLPSGAVLLVEEDMILREACDIIVSGQIVGVPGSGVTVALQAGRSLLVLGSVVAGTGADGKDVMMTAGDGHGGAGRPGGSVVLIGGADKAVCGSTPSCASHPVVLGPEALVAAGTGGRGGFAVRTRDSVLQGEAVVTAEGGAGGTSGMVFLGVGGGTPLILGGIHPGTGGPGGLAVASGLGSIARGGQGGRALPVYANNVDPEQLLAWNFAAVGGSGGVAKSGAFAPCSSNLPPIQGCTGNAEEDGCVTSSEILLHLGIGAQPEAEQGYNVEASGGPGGDGILYGGRGGDAVAKACDNPEVGFSGGPGANEYLTCVEPDPNGGCLIFDRIPPERGETGGMGPRGGTGLSFGGDGGVGLIRGGDGGSAEANGGQGGQGGRGGRGGDRVHDSICTKGAQGGDGGPGGSGGNSVARGGQGGDALLALGQGGKSPRGTGTPGSGGEGGLGGEGGNGGGASIGIGGWGIDFSGCTSEKGDPGSPGALGDTGGTDHLSGGDGQAGNMAPEDAVAYLGRIVCFQSSLINCLADVPGPQLQDGG